jgi:hypothetical protein
MIVPGVYVGALVVATLQLLRHRERRLFLLVALLAFLSLAHARDLPDPWSTVGHWGAGLSALGLAFVLVPRHPAR